MFGPHCMTKSNGVRISYQTNSYQRVKTCQIIGPSLVYKQLLKCLCTFSENVKTITDDIMNIWMNHWLQPNVDQLILITKTSYEWIRTYIIILKSYDASSNIRARPSCWDVAVWYRQTTVSKIALTTMIKIGKQREAVRSKCKRKHCTTASVILSSLLYCCVVARYKYTSAETKTERYNNYEKHYLLQATFFVKVFALAFFVV